MAKVAGFFKRSFGYLKTAADGFVNDSVPMMGAALAYYTMFSIAPLLIIAIGAAGIVFGESANVKIFDTIKGVVGAQGASAIESMVSAASKRPHAGFIATMVGLGTLIVGASAVFSQLQQSLNIIWKVASSPKSGWWHLIRQRLLSFAMVAVIGFVLLVSMVVSAALTAAGTWAGGVLPLGDSVWQGINFAVSLGIIGVLFSAVLKLLPDVQLHWRDVEIGGLVTALMFVIGKTIIGVYIGKSGVASTYGAAGSLIVVLLWVFYSSQILYFGAEFTRAYATRDGRKITPKEGAIFTIQPASSAALAEAVAEGSPNPVADKALEKAQTAWYAAAAGAAAVGTVLLARHFRGRGRSVAGGLLEGCALGMLAILKGPELLGRGKAQDEKGPSLASRVIAKIPVRVKLATAGGAVKGGGKEAGRELKAKAKAAVGARDR